LEILAYKKIRKTVVYYYSTILVIFLELDINMLLSGAAASLALILPQPHNELINAA
jgi:hypothetical protein